MSSSGSARRRARERFIAIAEGPDSAIDLGEAMAVIAAEDQPELAVVEQLHGLDRLASRLRDELRGASEPRARLEALCRGMFDELNFRGNSEDYYDPQNSYLHYVLKRRLGIPISLSVVLIEVGRRLGLSLEGVSFPVHFLACDLDAPGVFVDAFHGGALLDAAECEALLERMTAGQLAFEPAMLEPTGTREILVRALNNLKAIYVRRRSYGLALAAIDRILLLVPSATAQLRDRGLLNLHASRFRDAIDDLELYLDVNPRADDRLVVQARIAEARGKLGGR
ncbi:MAG: tetratricopeptide repeat protein [Myxococcales bacterium]|nr:tetratricopeptide repeat protein [Myxococcales bacterium]